MLNMHPTKARLITIHIILFCLVSTFGLAQNWQASYNDALGYYKAEDFQNSLLTAKSTLEKYRTESNLNQAYTLQLITSNYVMLNDPDNALVFCDQEMNLFQQSEGPKSKNLAEAMKKQIIFFQQKGNMQLAMEKCRLASTQFELSFGKQSLPFIQFLSFTGEIALAANDSVQAKLIWNECLPLLAKFEEAGESYEQLLLNTAALEENMRSYSTAKEKYLKLVDWAQLKQRTSSDSYPEAKAALLRLEKRGTNLQSSPDQLGLEQLLKSAISFQESKQYEKALEVFKQGEDVALKNNVNNKTSFSIYLNNSKLLLERGNTKAALKSIALAKAQGNALFSPDSFELIVVELVNADILFSAGLVEEAIDRYRVISLLATSDNLERIAPYFTYSGNLLLNADRPQVALKLIQPALSLLAKRSSKISLPLISIAIIYCEGQMSLNRLDSVLHLLNQPLFNQAAIVLELKKVEALQLRGDWSKAIDHLKLVSSRLPLSGFEKGSIDYQMARAMHSLGEYVEAEKYYQRASQTFGPAYPEDAWQVSNSLATLYSTLGNHDRSEKELTALLATVPSSHPLYLTLQQNLAANYIETNQIQKAKLLQEKIVLVEKDRVGENHPDYGFALSNLGALYLRERNYKEAQKLFEKALLISKTNFGDHHPAYAVQELNLGVTLKDMGVYEKASDLLQHALKVFLETTGNTHPNYVQCEYNLAMVYKRIGKIELAIPLMLHVGQFYKKQIIDLFPAMNEQDQVSFYNKISKPIQDYQQFIVELNNSRPDLLAQLFDFRLVSKAMLLNSSTKIRKQILSGNNTKLKDQFLLWLKLKDQLGQLYSSGDNMKATNQTKIAQLEERANSIESDMAKQSLLFKVKQEESEITWRKIQATLKPAEAAIEVIRLGATIRTDSVSYAALIIRKDKPYPMLVIFKKGKAMEGREFKYYRNHIIHEQLNARSFSVFWKDLEVNLNGIQTIFMSLDGVYNKINPATLYDPENADYLAGRYKFVLLSNLRDLNSKTNVVLKNKKASLIGFANFGESNKKGVPQQRTGLNKGIQSFLSDEMPSLPGTKIEIAKIDSMLRKSSWKSSVFQGSEATESNIKSIENSSAIHIATHGFFIETLEEEEPVVLSSNKEIVNNPLLRSGLILSDVGSTSSNSQLNKVDDGFLTAYEVKNLNFEETDFVVLSACETGSGEVRNGEGVYGLQRAFLLSGVNNVIMSLWKVDDQATQELMVKFYLKLLEGNDNVNSLRLAQLELKKKYPFPYYWGSFILVGKP